MGGQADIGKISNPSHDASDWTVPPQRDHQTFMNFDLVQDLDRLNADIAILGLPHGDPYRMSEVSNDQSTAPTAIRKASSRISGGLERWDFDLGGTLLDGKSIRMVDCGDVAADVRNLDIHLIHAEHAVRSILKAGALPIMLGGDHGIPIPALRAYEGHGPITVIQVDAHLDWIDSKMGVSAGYSSPMRRASQMDHVDQIFQIGLRCQGSARREEFEAAKAYGAHLVSDMELQQRGMDAVLSEIPDGANYYLTLDADGFDPSVMPAVAGPAPGGVTYLQAVQLIHGLVDKGRVVGMDICEITPQRDINDITSITAGRLILNLIGKAVRADYFD
ncbi:MAG: agmatinase [Alphaproteobacteria bacterium]|nr:agmatinase [Alphaproteobacteria bacterium]